MMHGSHPKPTSNLPQSANPWAHPGDNEERAKGWKIDRHWLYCSVPEFMKYLEVREAELAELKRKEVEGAYTNTNQRIESDSGAKEAPTND